MMMIDKDYYKMIELIDYYLLRILSIVVKIIDEQCNYVDMPPQQFSNANNYPTFLIEPQRRQLPSTPASIIEKEDDNDDDDDDGGGGSSTLDKQIKAKLLLLHQRHNSSIQKQSSIKQDRVSLSHPSPISPSQSSSRSSIGTTHEQLIHTSGGISSYSYSHRRNSYAYRNSIIQSKLPLRSIASRNPSLINQLLITSNDNDHNNRSKLSLNNS
ncbi:unnamed protein product, partial [Didymodactylos carnosus]